MPLKSTDILESGFIGQATRQLRASGWDVCAGASVVQLLREVGPVRQRGELRKTPLGGWDLYQRVMPTEKAAPMPAVALLACPRVEDFDWKYALHALDSCLQAALISD